MIRMGRGSRSEQPNETSYQDQTPEPAPLYQYSGEAVPSNSRAVTDSESMARDIKEGRLSGFVGHGTVLTGETNFQAMLRVDGHLVGTVSSDSGSLIVGTNGQVDANISVSSAMINGTVNGDIIASERIQLGRTAVVVGNVQTPRLVLEEGAVLEGGCSMMKPREVSEKMAAEAESQYKSAQFAQYEQAPVTAVADDDISDEYLGTPTDDDTDEQADAAAI